MASLEVVEGPTARPSSETVRLSQHEGSSIRADGPRAPISSGSAAGAAIGTERCGVLEPGVVLLESVVSAAGTSCGTSRFAWTFGLHPRHLVLADGSLPYRWPCCWKAPFRLKPELLANWGQSVRCAPLAPSTTIADENVGLKNGSGMRVLEWFRAAAPGVARKAVLAASRVRNKGRIGEVAARCQSAESEHQAAISWCEHSRRQPN